MVAHLSKARPTKVWPEWRRAGCTSAIGYPGRRLTAASLDQSASWAALAGHIGPYRAWCRHRHHALSEAAAARLPVPAAPAANHARPIVRMSAAGGVMAVLPTLPGMQPPYHRARGRKRDRPPTVAVARRGAAGAGAGVGVGTGEGAGASRPARRAAGRARLSLMAALEHDVLPSDDEEEEDNEDDDEEEEGWVVADEEDDEDEDEDKEGEDEDKEGEDEDEDEEGLVAAEAKPLRGTGTALTARHGTGDAEQQVEGMGVGSVQGSIWEEVEVEVEVKVGAESDGEVEVECEAVEVEATVVDE